MELPLTGGRICDAVRYEITQAPGGIYRQIATWLGLRFG
jgi:hypothetical protein